jgi:hypothetical protein
MNNTQKSESKFIQRAVHVLTMRNVKVGCKYQVTPKEITAQILYKHTQKGALIFFWICARRNM